MATYISDDPKLLDELFRKDGEGQLLVGYETGKETPCRILLYALSCQSRQARPCLYVYGLVQPTIDKSQILRLRTEYPSGNLFIPEDDGCTGYLRRYFQKGIYQSGITTLYPGKGTGSSNKYQSEKCPVCAVTQRYPHDIGRTSETDHTAVGRAGPFSSEAG